MLCNVWISGKINIYKKRKTSFQTTKPERVNKENKSGNEKQQTQNVNKNKSNIDKQTKQKFLTDSTFLFPPTRTREKSFEDSFLLNKDRGDRMKT